MCVIFCILSLPNLSPFSDFKCDQIYIKVPWRQAIKEVEISISKVCYYSGIVGLTMEQSCVDHTLIQLKDNNIFFENVELLKHMFSYHVKNEYM